MKAKIKFTSSALISGDEICSGGSNSMSDVDLVAKSLKSRASQTVDSVLRRCTRGSPTPLKSPVFVLDIPGIVMIA
jgi:hypothetical protein